MRILFVTPSESSSGEAITALHMAQSLAQGGHSFRVLASERTAVFFGGRHAQGVDVLSKNLEENRAAWRRVVADYRPRAIVFADYSLLFFEGGAPPLADDVWVEDLERTPAVLMTLDHLGYAQRSIRLHFGPPHLSFHCETVCAAPDTMRILLPCPLHEPRKVEGRRGEPFRFWTRPPIPVEHRRAIRNRLMPDPRGFLVLHSVPSWASRFAREFDLPYYDHLAEILDAHLAEVRGQVTVVSVNDGSLLAPPASCNVHFRNLLPRSKDEFEALLLASDLLLTENGVSGTLGKAVSALVPAVVLRNRFRLMELLSSADGPLVEIAMRMEDARSGAIFPYDVFPIWGNEELELLRLFEENSVCRCFERLEVFGDRTGRQMVDLLGNGTARDALRAAQQDYRDAVDRLPDPSEILQELLEVRS